MRSRSVRVLAAVLPACLALAAQAGVPASAKALPSATLIWVKCHTVVGSGQEPSASNTVSCDFQFRVDNQRIAAIKSIAAHIGYGGVAGADCGSTWAYEGTAGRTSAVFNITGCSATRADLSTDTNMAVAFTVYGARSATIVAKSLNIGWDTKSCGTHTLYSSFSQLTWAQAKTQAEALGGTLATPTTSALQSCVAALISGPSTWLGASDTATEGSWKWLGSATPFCIESGPTCVAQGGAYTAWALNNPGGGANENCLLTYPNDAAALWMDSDCTAAWNWMADLS